MRIQIRLQIYAIVHNNILQAAISLLIFWHSFSGGRQDYKFLLGWCKSFRNFLYIVSFERKRLFENSKIIIEKYFDPHLVTLHLNKVYSFIGIDIREGHFSEGQNHF